MQIPSELAGIQSSDCCEIFSHINLMLHIVRFSRNRQYKYLLSVAGPLHELTKNVIKIQNLNFQLTDIYGQTNKLIVEDVCYCFLNYNISRW